MYLKFNLLKIIYEDKDLLIINKCYNVLNYGYSIYNSIINILIFHYPYLFFLYKYGIIHRLDKNTTGILIFAKNTITQFRLIKYFKKKLIIKNYFVICYGKNKINKLIKAFIFRKNQKFITNNQYGKKTITNIFYIKNIKNIFFYLIGLETGRTHQIRSTLEYLNYSILNDKMYGNYTNLNFSQDINKILKKLEITLLSIFIKFKHPILNFNIRLYISMPDELILLKNQFEIENIKCV